jgi:transposase
MVFRKLNFPVQKKRRRNGPIGPDRQSTSKMVKALKTKVLRIMGTFAANNGVSKTSKLFRENKGRVKYWKTKVQNPTFRSSSHGGLRRPVWDSETRSRLEMSVWMSISENPFLGLKDLQRKVLDSTQISVSKTWLRKLFKKWRWSLKKPDWKQLQKYSQENVAYYLQFVKWIQNLPSWTNVKTFDEAHFRSSDMRKRKGWGPVGSKVTGISPSNLAENYSLLMLTSISEEDVDDPLTSSILPHNVTSWDVLDFFLDCLENKKLVAGDILLLDNARTHTQAEMLPVLVDVLEKFGVTMKFLPKYSPELNPCEFVFSVIKKKIRNSLSSEPLWFQIFQRTHQFPVQLLRNEYLNCWYYTINQI